MEVKGTLLPEMEVKHRPWQAAFIVNLGNGVYAYCGASDDCLDSDMAWVGSAGGVQEFASRLWSPT